MVAEWWLHSRAHTAGHQLHYDTDEQRLRRGQGVHCPAVSTVLYLEAGGGSPTIVADQRFGEPLAQRGWVCEPNRGRLLMFDGSLLHGVLPAYTGASL